MVWDRGYLKISRKREFLLCANLFVLPANARNREPYIMSSMDEVAFNGFGHLYFLSAGKGNIVFQIRNKMRPWIGGRGGALS